MLRLPWNLSRHTLTQLCIWCCVAGQHWFSADRARGPSVRGLLQDPGASLLAVLLAVRPTVRVLQFRARSGWGTRVGIDPGIGT